jgi:hypothetical protein
MKAQTDDRIRAALRNLPEDLRSSYQKIMTSIIQGDPWEREFTLRLFRWVACAHRPLTLKELVYACALEEGQTETNNGNLLNDHKAALTLCQHLIRLGNGDQSARTERPTANITESIMADEQYVEFIHASVKDFLLPQHSGENGVDANFIGREPEIHLYLSRTCLTYLSFDCFQKPLEVDNKKSDHPTSPPNLWCFLMLNDENYKNFNKGSVENRLYDMCTTSTSSLSSMYPLLAYSMDHWNIHWAKCQVHTTADHTSLSCPEVHHSTAVRPWFLSAIFWIISWSTIATRWLADWSKARISPTYRTSPLLLQTDRFFESTASETWLVLMAATNGPHPAIVNATFQRDERRRSTIPYNLHYYSIGEIQVFNDHFDRLRTVPPYFGGGILDGIAQLARRLNKQQESNPLLVNWNSTALLGLTSRIGHIASRLWLEGNLPITETIFMFAIAFQFLNQSTNTSSQQHRFFRLEDIIALKNVYEEFHFKTICARGYHNLGTTIGVLAPNDVDIALQYLAEAMRRDPDSRCHDSAFKLIYCLIDDKLKSAETLISFWNLLSNKSVVQSTLVLKLLIEAFAATGGTGSAQILKMELEGRAEAFSAIHLSMDWMELAGMERERKRMERERWKRRMHSLVSRI